MRCFVSCAAVPVAAFLLVVVSPMLIAADGDPAAPATQVAPETVIHATMAKKGKVHFGPSLNSKEAAILDAGAEVEVLGVAKGLPDWFVVRFPRSGTAWVHAKVLQPLEDGKTFRVTEDRARARDDATLRSNIVAELAKGEIVESKGKKIGDWQAVYPPSAVAYVHKSVLNLPANVAAGIQKNQAVANQSEAAWLEAKAIYARYKQVLDRQNFDLAATLDWSNLHRLLAQVVKDHTDAATRNEAQELDSKIAKVVQAAEKVQREHGLTATREIPGEPPIEMPKPVAATTVAATTPAGTAEPAAKPVGDAPPATVAKVPASGDAPAKPADPAAKPAGEPARVDAGDFKAAAAQAPKAPASIEYAVTGLINVQANAQLGTSHVIIDQEGKVRAFLKVKPGSPLQLSEFFWNNVGVVGEIQEVDPAKTGGVKTPLVIVVDIRLLH